MHTYERRTHFPLLHEDGDHTCVNNKFGGLQTIYNKVVWRKLRDAVIVVILKERFEFNLFDSATLSLSLDGRCVACLASLFSIRLGC